MSVEAISAVLHNSKATGTRKLVLIGIANHEGDGGAWPTIDTLGKYAGCTRTTVKDAIRWLVKNGELQVFPQAGGNANTRPDRRPNLYKVLVRPYGGRVSDSRRQNDGRNELTRGAEMTLAGGEGSPPNRPIEPSLLEIDFSITTTFDRFWSNYPRKTAIGAARDSFAKAIRKGVSPSKMIDAAARFRDDPNREDEFTPHASTWLNQGRYDDGPLPEKAKTKAQVRNIQEIERTKQITHQVKRTISPAIELELSALRKRLGRFEHQENTHETSKAQN
jgi:hypothetical protein